jgi:parvulin-like peptidyl-prolyl isomerase
LSKKLKVEGSTRRAEPKRRPSRWEREKKRRIILEIIILVVIVGVVAAGVVVAYDQYIKPWHQPIVRVNDRVFDMNYFVKMLRLWGGGQDYIQSAQSVVEVIQYHELLRQAAEEFGIEVSDNEIEDKIKSYLSFDPANESEQDFNQRVDEALKGAGLSRADFEEMFIEPMLLETKLREYIGYQKYPQDEALQHVQVKALLLGTEEEALEAEAKWVGGEDLNQLVKEYSPAQYWPQGGYWLVRFIEETGNGTDRQLHIQGILLVNKEKAEEVASEFDGENFAQLAEKYSLDFASKDNGGDLGWLTSDAISSKFGADNLDAILALGLNELSEPVSASYVEWLPQGIESSVFDDFAFSEGSEDIGISEPIRDTTYWTNGGYWLIIVLGKEGEGDEETMHLQGILLDSKEEADFLFRSFPLIQENFAQLAKEYSLHSSSAENGGDMGWLSVADVESRFGADVLDLPLNTLSEPIYEDISKQSGYWVIEVLGKDERALSEEHRDLLSSQAFSDWREEEENKAKEEGRIESYLDYDKIFWALTHI